MNVPDNLGNDIVVAEHYAHLLYLSGEMMMFLE